MDAIVNVFQTLRARAMGVYNWGIYIGYSLSYALGNFIVGANIDGKGWRWVFSISAIPGFIVAPLIFFTIKERAGKIRTGQSFVNIAVSVRAATPCNWHFKSGHFIGKRGKIFKILLFFVPEITKTRWLIIHHQNLPQSLPAHPLSSKVNKERWWVHMGMQHSALF